MTEETQPSRASALADEILDFLWLENPVEATLAGIHRYDDRLEKLDQVSRRNKLRRKKEYLESIRALQNTRSSNLELDLLDSDLAAGVRLEENTGSLDRDASLYPRLALYGIYQLIARSSSDYHYRALRAVDRLREVPRVFAEGKLNLSYGENIPRIWTLAAIELTSAGREYLSKLVAMLCDEVPDLQAVVQKYAQLALKAFEDFLEFLIEEIQPRSAGSCGVGQELFDFLLAQEHRLSLGGGALRRLALEESGRVEAELSELAGELGSSGDWRKALDSIIGEPPESGLLMYWKKIIDEVRREIRQAKLVTLPSAEQLRLVETPPFERFVIASAGYIEAPIFEPRSRAFFCVTPLADSPREEDREATLRLHSRPYALATVIRELYPGRHTLLTRRKAAGQRLAYLSRGNILEDGWGSYVLGLVAEQGLFEADRLKLLSLHQRLVAARLVLADLDIHTQGLDELQTVRRLAQSTGITERQAWVQVRRLASSPTASVGALVGRLKIENWREALRQKDKARFSLKKFHDSLLRLSALPLDRVERRMLKAAGQRR